MIRHICMFTLKEENKEQTIAAFFERAQKLREIDVIVTHSFRDKGVKFTIRSSRSELDACEIVPEIGYVGWDVCLGPTAPCLIEGNDFPGHDLYQLPVHRKGNTGLLPLFEEAMKGDKK